MKKLFTFAALVLSATLVHADFLYWLIDQNDGMVKSEDYNKAILYADGGSGASQLGVITLANGYADVQSRYSGSVTYPYQSDIASAIGEGYSYFVELMNDDTFVARSAEIAYASIKDSIYAGGIGIPSSIANPAMFTTFSVPEPTSGVLFLIGGVLLGLKRRRMA